MSQSIPENPFQEQDNLIKDTNVGGDLNYAPVQVDTQTVNNITNNHYISQVSSEAQIRSSKLIKGSPYLGLEKFDVEDSDKFFGRDRWIVELTNYLEKENVLLLLGASGSGKSSLIQAGLIPKLKDQWGSQLFNFTFVPDVDPFESFYGCLLTRYKQSDAKTARMVQENTLIKVVDSLKKEGIQWLIFIDQFEELFTRTPQNERDVFVNSLIQLIDKKDPTVKVVMTMRADFLDKLGPYPALGRIHDHQSRMLTDMEDGDLRLAIAEPAARNGVTFETGLIDQIIADFKQQAGSLPLLQYTLDLLWKDDGINDDDRVLNIETYEKLGGVTGALEKQADEIFKNPHNEPEKLNEAERKASEQIFIKLIGLEGKEPVSKRQNKSLFCDGATQESALNKLVDNRLLVIQGKGETATVEVAHEALLRSWKVLQALIREKEEILILRTRLEQDAKNWQDFCKKNPSQAEQYDEFLTVPRLNRIIKLINEKSLVDLDSVIVKFIRASREYRQQLQKAEAERKQREIDSELSLANSLGRYSLSIFQPERSLNSLIEAIKAGKILQKYQTKDWTVVAALYKALTQGMEGNNLIGHGYAVTNVSFSPDGQTLASGSRDNTIKLWKVETGENLFTLTGHKNDVYSVSFSPDGQILASASADKTVRLWKVKTGEEFLILMGHKSAVSSVSFSPDGQTLASGSGDNAIKLWKVETGEEFLTLMGHESAVSSVSFSPNGQTLASGSYDETIKLWKVERGEEFRTLTGHGYAVTNVSFSPDGQTLASGSEGGTIKLWKVQTGEELYTLKGHEYYVRSVSFSPDGQTLASASGDETIKLWKVETGEALFTLTGHEDLVYSVSFSPDGQTFASSGDNTIKLWKIETGEALYTPTGHEDSIYSVSFSPDGQTLASGSRDNTIKLWKVETGEQLLTLTGHEGAVNSVSFSPDGQTLTSASDDETIKLWKVETGEQLLTLTGHESYVRSVSFSPDGQILASGSYDGAIKLWKVKTGEELYTLKGHEYYVYYVRSVSFSPDGQTLASTSGDKMIKIKLWKVETGEEFLTLMGYEDIYSVYSVSFSPDGQTLATGSGDNTIKLWKVETGKILRTLTGHEDSIYSVSFSPDGQALASGSYDGTIKMWKVATGEELLTLTGNEDSIYSVSFSPDGQTLASGSYDGTIRLWDLNLDSLMAKSCDWVRGYLTHNPKVSESDRHLCDGIGTKQ